MNMVQSMYAHACKCKMIPVETTPGIGKRGWARAVEGGIQV
jgi:hypothetical protein